MLLLEVLFDLSVNQRELALKFQLVEGSSVNCSNNELPPTNTDTRLPRTGNWLFQQDTIKAGEKFRNQKRIVREREVSVRKEILAENGLCIPVVDISIQESRG